MDSIDDEGPIPEVLALETVEQIMLALDTEGRPDYASDYVLSGALLVAFYTAPTGDASATWTRALGGMNAYTQEGVLRSILRDMERREPDED